MQEGATTWTYALPKDAEFVTVKIKDGSGNIVYSGTMQNESGSAEMTAGTYSFGITNADLTKAQADGAVLTMSITAHDKDGTPITADIHTTVKVEKRPIG